MRTILAVLFVFVFLILELPFMGVMWVIGRFNRPFSDIVQLRVVQWGFRVVMFIGGTKLIVRGKEKIPKDEAVLYICNHRSYWDVITTYTLCPGLTGYIAKNGIDRVPILGLVMRRLYCLFMDREDIRQSMKVILKAVEQVKSGISICIFPEGTRFHDPDHVDTMLPFKEGSFKIAAKSGCRIVPVAILGSAEALENHLPWVKKCTVTVTYGDPISLKTLDKDTQKHMGAYVQNVIANMLRGA